MTRSPDLAITRLREAQVRSPRAALILPPEQVDDLVLHLARLAVVETHAVAVVDEYRITTLDVREALASHDEDLGDALDELVTAVDENPDRRTRP